MEIGNIDVFLGVLAKTSACNKIFRKKFLRPETIGLLPRGFIALITDITRKPLFGFYIWNRWTAVRHSMSQMDLNTDLNCRITV